MKISLGPFKNKLIEGFRYKTILFHLTHLLSKAGFKIIPYYLTREATQENLKINLPSGLEHVDCGFLGRDYIEKVFNHPETTGLRTTISKYRDDICYCFALKYNEDVMSFMWCNLTRCDLPISPFILKVDEAYLFEAYTYKKYRGMNLAPYLRNQLYIALSERGRTKLFSGTEYFNTPAIHFKRKLHAKHLKLGVFINLFFKFKWKITLRDFQVYRQSK